MSVLCESNYRPDYFSPENGRFDNVGILKFFEFENYNSS